jgi:hypothetical protein
MRIFRFVSIALLSVLVGSAALLYAQDEKPQEDKPAEQAKPAPKQDQEKPDMAKPSKQDDKQEKKQEKQDEKQSHEQAMPGQQDHPGQPAAHEQGNMEHPEQAHPGNGKGGHIPDKDFHAHFGRSHTFTAKTVIVSGQPQFQYSGYSFQLVDAWPVGWAYTDDCYIDYIDGGYFLFDLLHPGVQVAVIVVM